jgi:hypothetical protein
MFSDIDHHDLIAIDAAAAWADDDTGSRPYTTEEVESPPVYACADHLDELLAEACEARPADPGETCSWCHRDAIAEVAPAPERRVLPRGHVIRLYDRTSQAGGALLEEQVEEPPSEALAHRRAHRPTEEWFWLLAGFDVLARGAERRARLLFSIARQTFELRRRGMI